MSEPAGAARMLLAEALRRQGGGCERQEGLMSRSAPVSAMLLLIASGFAHVASAQERADMASPVQPNFSFPAGVEITSQWNYSCRDSKPCAFSCGSADSVKALTMYLGTIPVGNNQRNLVLFYFYSTATLPHNYGFRISGGPASTLSCDVSGMTLDYAGPPTGIPQSAPSNAR
jgi:hypothetical protein